MKVLKLGSQGPEVKELQLLLNSHNFNLVVDGDFGNATKTAVKAFQIERGLTPDSVVGPQTWDALEKAHNIEVVHDPEVKITELDDRTEKYFKTLDPKAQKIFLPFIVEAKKIAQDMGFDYLAISGNRTPEEQQKLYDQGRKNNLPIVTNSKPYQSNHQYGIALDFGVFKDGKYLDEKSPGIAEKVHLAVAKIASKYGIDAGAFWKNFKDQPHFEVETGLTLTQKKKLLIEKGTVL